MAWRRRLPRPGISKRFSAMGLFSRRRTRMCCCSQNALANTIMPCIVRMRPANSRNPRCGSRPRRTWHTGATTSSFSAAASFGTSAASAAAHRQFARLADGWRFTTATAAKKRMPALELIPRARCFWISKIPGTSSDAADKSLCRKPNTRSKGLCRTWYFQPALSSRTTVCWCIMARRTPSADWWNSHSRNS